MKIRKGLREEGRPRMSNETGRRARQEQYHEFEERAISVVSNVPGRSYEIHPSI